MLNKIKAYFFNLIGRYSMPTILCHDEIHDEYWKLNNYDSNLIGSKFGPIKLLSCKQNRFGYWVTTGIYRTTHSTSSFTNYYKGRNLFKG